MFEFPEEVFCGHWIEGGWRGGEVRDFGGFMRGGEDAHNEINVDELKFIGMWNKNI